MYNQLSDIKATLLKYNPYFNAGYGLFFIDQENGLIRDYESETAIHINDDKGNYFFFVLDGLSAAAHPADDALIYALSTPVKLICVYKNASPLKLRTCILNSLKGISGFNLTTPEVVRSLMPESEDETVLSVLKSLGAYQVASFDIILKERLVRNECVCEICESC